MNFRQAKPSELPKTARRLEKANVDACQSECWFCLASSPARRSAPGKRGFSGTYHNPGARHRLSACRQTRLSFRVRAVWWRWKAEPRASGAPMGSAHFPLVDVPELLRVRRARKETGYLRRV